VIKKTSFTIVNRPFDTSANRESLESDLLGKLREQIKGTAPTFEMIPPGLMEAMVSTLLPGSFAKAAKTKGSGDVDILAQLPPDLVDAVRRISLQATTATTVGILDLGAWVSRLPELLQVLNKAQSRYTFLEVQTPVPAGLIKTKEPLVAWAERLLERRLKPREKSEIVRNMLADEFFYFAESVRQQHRLDYIFGLTPAMIAFADTEGPAWNYYAWGKDGVAVLSTCDLREFADKARRPYEAAVGMLIVTQTMVKRTPLKRHPSPHQCVFDFNAVRAGLVDSIREMRIHDGCLQTLEEHDHEEALAAQALVSALSSMKGGSRG
jgi:hypothetical protein